MFRKNLVSWLASMLVMALLLSGTFVQAAFADDGNPPQPWTNTETEVRPDLGPTVPNLEPGTNGYKVFNPGAIKIAPVQSVRDYPQSPMAPAAVYRSGYTDVWGTCCTWVFTGSHTSDSDLFETQIWADGYLKYQSDTGWRNSCSNHTSGTRAHCNTSFTGWYYTVYAETKHHFHTSGYVDSNFTTADTY